MSGSRFEVDIEGAEFEVLESFLKHIHESDLLAKINIPSFYIE